MDDLRLLAPFFLLLSLSACHERHPGKHDAESDTGGDTSITRHSEETESTGDTSSTGDTEDASLILELEDVYYAKFRVNDGVELALYPAGVGDLDLDGNDDVAITGYVRSYDAEYPHQSNPLFLFLDIGTGVYTHSSHDFSILEEEESIWPGALGGGDMNGDGFDDLLVLDLAEHDGLVFFGPLESLDLTDADAELFGEGVSNLLASGQASADGDMNGDGISDLVMGSNYVRGEDPYFRGVAWVVLGPVVGSISMADAQGRFYDAGGTYGATTEGTGRATTCVPDTNGDGLDDLLSGAPWIPVDGEYYGGGAYLVLGPATGGGSIADAAEATLIGEADPWGGPGLKVSGLGDLNGDGYGDFAIGGYTNSVWVVHGPVDGVFSLPEVAVRIDGQEEPYDEPFYPLTTNEAFGDSLAKVGDVDGDGLADLLIGAPCNLDDSGYFPGSAYLFLGPVEGAISSTDAEVTFVYEESALIGKELAGAGDVNADGLQDMLIGGSLARDTYLVLGQDFGSARYRVSRGLDAHR